MARARPHRIFCLGSDTGQAFAQGIWSRGECTVDLGHIRIEGRHDFIPLRVADKGAVERYDLGLGAAFIQHVLEVAEARLQAHHPEFAQAVDWRIGDLTKVLAEEMAQRAVFFRQDGTWGVIAHRRQGFFAVLGHGGEDVLQLFDRIAGCDLAAAQVLPCIYRAL